MAIGATTPINMVSRAKAENAAAARRSYLFLVSWNLSANNSEDIINRVRSDV